MNKINVAIHSADFYDHDGLVDIWRPRIDYLGTTAGVAVQYCRTTLVLVFV